MALPPFLDSDWKLLTPQADLSRTVRWAHTIGAPRPATLLEGNELVLSTLPRFGEDTADLVAALRTYIDDLDSVRAAALAVEILPDRPRLLEALTMVIAERMSGAATTRTLPVILFSNEVRFIDIIEQVHRRLVTHQLSQKPPVDSHDPLFDASTQLIRDVSSGRIASTEEAERRAQVLGSVGADHYCSLTLRFRTPGTLSAEEHARAQQSISQTVRTVAARSGISALVGATASNDMAIVAALTPNGEKDAASAFCLNVKRAVDKIQAPSTIPTFIISAGRPSPTILTAVSELKSAEHVLRSLEVVLSRSEKFPDFETSAVERGYWTAEDLGVLGLLARMDDQEGASWFTAAQLRRLHGPGSSELRELIRALASPTGTKAELAVQLGISRPTLYARMHRLERRLGHRLDGDTLLALHIALLMEDLQG